MLIPPQRILVLYCSDGSGELRPSMRHHLHALEASPIPHRLVYHDAMGGTPSWLGRFPCDAVILHTTLLSMRWNHLFPHLRQELRWLSPLECPKVALAQDEYDHSEILDEWLAELGVSIICTTFDEPHRRILYPIMHDKALFARCLTGYIDDRTAQRCAPKLPPTAARTVDIAYRAYRPLYWYGSHGQLKHRMACVVAARAAERGLRCDISTRDEDVILGDRWFTFLGSAKATIGCETGSSVLSRRGEARRQIQSLLRLTPGLSFDEVHARMPAGWDDYRFLAMGPRHFEAIITRTCQILVEGSYDGILEPHRHYIPLKRDFSNVGEVLEKVRNPLLLEEIASCAYEEIYLGGRCSYATLARTIEHALARAAGSPPPKGVQPPAVPWQSLRPTLALWTRWKRGTHQALRALACLKLYLGEWAVRKMLHGYLGKREIREAVRLSQVLRELVRVGILSRTLRERAASPQAFGVMVRFDVQEERVVLVSVPVRGNNVSRDGRSECRKGGATGDPDWPVLEGAFREGRIREILWDHWAVGTTVRYPGAASRWLEFFLGEDGIYRLEALSSVARQSPRQAIRLLRSILRKGAQPAAGAAGHR